jgi:hypothetical protein
MKFAMNNIPSVILSSSLSLSTSSPNIIASQNTFNDCYKPFTNTVFSFFDTQLSNIQASFKKGIIEKEFSLEEKAQAKAMLERMLPFIKNLNPSQITFAVTWDKSLYFRLKKGNFDIHSEFFFTVDEDETAGEEIEIVSTVYDVDKTILKQVGRIDKIWAIIEEATQTKPILAKDLRSVKFSISNPKKDDANLSTAVSASDLRYNSRSAQS